MRSKQHLIGLIAKKCAQLKIENGYDAFFEITSHVNQVQVDVFRDWHNDSETMLFSGSSSIDGAFNPNSNSMSLMDIIENLDALLIGVGFE